MKNILLSLTVLMFVSQSVLADDLVPATSDDVKEFDQQVAKSTESSDAKDLAGKKDAQGKSADHRKDGDHSKKEAKAKKDNFGALVSAEAKKLKDESVDQRKEMGQWVSNQRRKNGTAPVGSGDSGGAGHSGSSNDRSDSPGVNMRDGGSSNSHGGGKH